MSRSLFVVPPPAGHAYLAAAVTMALSEQGHEVSLVGSEAGLRPFLGPHISVRPTGMRAYRRRLDVGAAAVKEFRRTFREEYVARGRQCGPGLPTRCRGG